LSPQVEQEKPTSQSLVSLSDLETKLVPWCNLDLKKEGVLGLLSTTNLTDC